MKDVQDHKFGLGLLLLSKNSPKEAGQKYGRAYDRAQKGDIK